MARLGPTAFFFSVEDLIFMLPCTLNLYGFYQRVRKEKFRGAETQLCHPSPGIYILNILQFT